MDKNLIKSQILDCLSRLGNKIEITYDCNTTRTNGELTYARIGDCERIDINNNTHIFEYDLQEVVNELRGTYTELHVIKGKHEFHYYYPGFNSCQTEVVPLAISNNPLSSEVVKTGKVKERYSMLGKKEVLEIIKAHPSYELYSRTGFGYRGAQEGKTTIEHLTRTLVWMACADVEVIDNEIHVNAFSCNDMW